MLILSSRRLFFYPLPLSSSICTRRGCAWRRICSTRRSRRCSKRPARVCPGHRPGTQATACASVSFAMPTAAPPLLFFPISFPGYHLLCMPEEMQRRFGYQSAVDEIFDFFHEFGAPTVTCPTQRLHTEQLCFSSHAPVLISPFFSPLFATISVYYTMRRDEVLAMGNQVFLMGVAIRNDSVPDVYTMLRVDPSLASISLNDRAMIGPTTTEVRVHTYLRDALHRGYILPLDR